MNLEHVAINVPEPVQAARWYCEHLGMRVLRRMDKSPWTHFLADSAGTGLIELYCDPEAPLPDYASLPPATLHLAFTATDLATDRSRLIAVGASPIGEIMTSPRGDRSAFLHDPWGLALQITARLKPMV